MRPVAALLCCTTLIALAPAPAQATEYQLANPWRLEQPALAAPLQPERAATPASWAPAVTAAPTLVLNGLSLATGLGLLPGNGFYYAMGSMAVSPLSVLPGYAMVGEPGRGALVALGGYGLQLVGAIGTGMAMASMSTGGQSAGFAYMAGLFIGPLLVNTGLALWAAHDVGQIAERKRAGTW